MVVVDGAHQGLSASGHQAIMPSPVRIDGLKCSRPKGPSGLWVLVTLVDGKQVTGVLAENLLRCRPWRGITFASYPEYSIPRRLMVSVEVLELIGIGDQHRRMCEVPKR